ncbi:hypothetical protein ACLB1R_27315 [Escherichia coli]
MKRPGRPWTPRHNLSQQKKRVSNNTALILSAVAIAIALAAGVGLYGWGKQQAVNQTATSDALANQLTALQKAQESQKAELEGIIKQQAAQLKQANRQQETLAKQLDEVQQKVATISGSDAKTWLLAQADFLVKLAGMEAVERSGRHDRCSVAEKCRRQPGGYE